MLSGKVVLRVIRGYFFVDGVLNVMFVFKIFNVCFLVKSIEELEIVESEVVSLICSIFIDVGFVL